jgi:hypothetical protein
MTSEWMTKPELLGPFMGIMTAFNCLTDELVKTKVIDGEALAAALQTKIDEWRQGPASEVTDDAANVLDQFRRPLVDATRLSVRKLLSDEPKGQA